MSGRFLTLGFVAVLLAGCSTVPGSYHNWMGDGYAHQRDNQPITKPAPSTPWFETAIYSQQIQDDNKAAWSSIALAMVNKLKPHIPPSNTPIVLQKKGTYIPEQQAFDHFFRQALIESNYVLSTDPAVGQVIYFDIKHLEKWTRDEKVAAIGDANILPGANGETKTPLPNYSIEISTMDIKNWKTLWAEKIAVHLPYEADLHRGFPGFRDQRTERDPSRPWTPQAKTPFLYNN